MSVYYDVREHMVISDPDEGYDYAGILRGHLALAGALMLCGEVKYCDIKLVADQKTYLFNETKVTQALHDIMDALDGAQKIDLRICWKYRWTGWNSIADLASANTMCSQLHTIDEEDEIPESVFYCCYVEADCDDSIGGAEAYGVWNGKRYHGALECCSIEQLPEEGTWRTPQTAVIWDVAWPEGVNRKRITEIAQELSTLSEMDNISIDENSISLYINNVMLHGKKDLQKYIELCTELNELTDGDCCFVEEFEDFDSLNPRILRMETGKDGEWKFQIAEV